MKPSYGFYRRSYRIARAALGIFFRFNVTGKENIPDGAAMICANHSSYIDPIFVAFAFGIEHYVHFIAKIELFRVPVLSAIIIKLGAISVDRGVLDVKTIKDTLGYLRKGEKVAIFPEGIMLKCRLCRCSCRERS
jgi:1-acyl-sn-glycerol-3-phosphate acyltransferase